MDFNSWLMGQGIDPGALPDKDAFRRVYELAQVRGEAIQASTLSPGTTGGHSYATAIEDGTDLRVTLWVRRAPRICVVLYPRDRDWNPHVTYHLDGRFHTKSYGMASGVQHRQRLDQFKGSEHLGIYYGHGGPLPKCDPADYSDVLRVPAGILKGHEGAVMVDLVEPGGTPDPVHRAPYEVIQEKTFTDCLPWVVMAVVVRRAK